MRIPVSTYRLQFRGGFGFREAKAVIPYLSALGITDVYASPLMRARPGSSSGYDIVDPTRLDPELGTAEEFNAFIDELKSRGMGLVLDIVPNHMAAHSTNPWWRDILENGICSPYANYFDIEWDPQQRREEKLVWPVLGGPYGEVLEKQQLSLAIAESGFVLRYFDLELPLDPATYGTILADPHNSGVDLDPETLHRLIELAEFSNQIPYRTTTDAAEVTRRYREKEDLKRRLWSFYSENAAFRVFLDETIRQFNGTLGDPRSFDSLEQLLDQQAFALSFWKIAREKINYRRFFDIVDLVGVNVQDREVFVNSHVLVARLLEAGAVTGLRIDHVDGLYDPLGYLLWLQERFPDCYTVVEKIVHRDEVLPAEWPVAGTTGYDFLNAAGNLMVDPAGLARLDEIYSRFTGDAAEFADVVYEQKKRVIGDLFRGELLSLTLQLSLLAEGDRYAKDVSPRGLRETLREVTACLPVYRTYTRTLEVRSSDRAVVEEAVREARRRNPSLGDAELGFVERVLLLNFRALHTGEERAAWRRFVQRWQQFSGPATAKGLEDTAFYVWSRLISMNEVGGYASSVTSAGFHRFVEARIERQPHSVNASSTHDTKRGEDARARISVLSEIPEQWERALNRWRRLNARSKPIVDGTPVPDPCEELFLYQTLLGAWPADPDNDDAKYATFQQRIQECMRKSLREGKIHTSWAAPSGAYEEAVRQFIFAILERSPENRFLADFIAFEERIAANGALNSLSQTLVRLTAPGVADTYQGSELWDLNLVDPDNRRPVDFPSREQLLHALANRSLGGLLDEWHDGALKLYVLNRALLFRRENSVVFLDGNYIPFEAAGSRADHVLSYGRQHGGRWVAIAVPRLIAKLSPSGRPPLGRRAWANTELQFPASAPRRWSHIFTCETIEIPESRRAPLAKFFAHFPVALLTALPD